MKQRVIALLLSLCMIVTLFGCGAKEQQSTETKSPETEQSTAAPAPAPEKEAETAAPEEDVDLAFSAYEDTVVVSTVLKPGSNYHEGDDEINNVWTRLYKERFNLELDVQWVSDEFNTKLNLAIANGDIPDVFECNDAQLKQLVDAGMVWDLSEVYEKYGSDMLKHYMEASGGVYEACLGENGEMYSVPKLHYSLQDQVRYIWIRDDWKEALGLEDPKTMQDVENIAKAFMENYGAYGMYGTQALDTLYMTACAWNAYPTLWVEQADGTIGYGAIQPEMKTAVSVWADWYKQGILDPDFAFKDYSAAKEGLATGKCGIIADAGSWGSAFGADVCGNLGIEAIFYPYEIPSAIGGEAKAPILFQNLGHFVVSKKCENPEALIKMMNMYAYIYGDYASIENEGIDQVVYIVDDPAPFQIKNPESNTAQVIGVQKALTTGDTSALTTSSMWDKYTVCQNFIETQDPKYLSSWLQMGHPENAFLIGNKIMDNEQYVKDAIWGAKPEELVQYGSVLDSILVEGFTKIIMGEESIDYFDTLVENWKAAGGDTVTAAVNRDYGNK